MLIESGERWRRPDEPPPDRWTDAGFRPLLPWVHVLVLSTASLFMPGLAGVVVALIALGFALEVAHRHVRAKRRGEDSGTRPPWQRRSAGPSRSSG